MQAWVPWLEAGPVPGALQREGLELMHQCAAVATQLLLEGEYKPTFALLAMHNYACRDSPCVLVLVCPVAWLH